jgi:hypothetical protein
MNKKIGLFKKFADDKFWQVVNIHLENIFHSFYDAFMNNLPIFSSKWMLQVGSKIWLENNQESTNLAKLKFLEQHKKFFTIDFFKFIRKFFRFVKICLRISDFV